jgi:uncharacterized protein YndB with AHSA1/START domain
MNKVKGTDTSDRELVLTRTLDAPRELVWKVWTDPKHVAIWWGPNGFTNTIHEMSVVSGGKWRFIMHGPDGTNYPNRIVFTEVVKPERLIYTHSDDNDNDPNQFEVTVTFEAIGKKTKVTLKVIMKSVKALEEAKKSGAVEGGQQTLQRLEKYLAEMQK